MCLAPVRAPAGPFAIPTPAFKFDKKCPTSELRPGDVAASRTLCDRLKRRLAQLRLDNPPGMPQRPPFGYWNSRWPDRIANANGPHRNTARPGCHDAAMPFIVRNRIIAIRKEQDVLMTAAAGVQEFQGRPEGSPYSRPGTALGFRPELASRRPEIEVREPRRHEIVVARQRTQDLWPPREHYQCQAMAGFCGCLPACIQSGSPSAFES